jgi:NADH dehydrogenase
VIAGGGFAGVTLAQRLERSLPEEMEIVVLSAQNHLVFTPMLPEMVGRTISPLHVVVAGRQLTRRTKWLEARVSLIDREKNEAHYVRRDGTTASIRYSHLALACGSASNLEEIPGLASRGYPLKTVMDAIVMQRLDWQLRSRRNRTRTEGAAAAAHRGRHWRRLQRCGGGGGILQTSCTLSAGSTQS